MTEPVDGTDVEIRLNVDDLKRQVVQFELELREAGLADSAVHSYADHGNRFIRWLTGDYRPRDAPGPAGGTSRGRTSWSLTELSGELEAYRRELQAAKLRPLAIQTYTASSGAFVRWLGGTYSPGGAKRTSHETAAIETILSALGPADGVEVFRGTRPDNRLPVPGWELTALQQLQFGDLRFETHDVRIVVEVESAGGVTNLVKYWPLLENTLDDKRFVLVHLFQIGTANDYIAHRQLWSFLVEQMKPLVKRVHKWTAHLRTYGPAADPASISSLTQLIRAELNEGS